MKSGTWNRNDFVSFSDFGTVNNLVFLYNSYAESGNIIIARLIHPSHLGSFTTNQSAIVILASIYHSKNDFCSDV